MVEGIWSNCEVGGNLRSTSGTYSPSWFGVLDTAELIPRIRECRQLHNCPLHLQKTEEYFGTTALFLDWIGAGSIFGCCMNDYVRLQLLFFQTKTEPSKTLTPSSGKYFADRDNKILQELIGNQEECSRPGRRYETRKWFEELLDWKTYGYTRKYAYILKRKANKDNNW